MYLQTITGLKKSLGQVVLSGGQSTFHSHLHDEQVPSKSSAN